MVDFNQSLSQIAFRQSMPFCHQCYTRAPSGHCATCYSDDLMCRRRIRRGVDHTRIAREHLTPANTLEAFERTVSECYPETTKICWIEYDTASAPKELDPVFWNMAHSKWLDEESSDGNLVTLDNGSTYYWASDLEGFITDFETESSATSS